MHTFVEGAACQMSAVGTEGHAVDGLLVFGECVDTDASLHVPETNRGVKGCTVDTQTVTTCSKMDAMTYHARLLGEGSLLLLLFVQLFHNIAPKDRSSSTFQTDLKLIMCKDGLNLSSNSKSVLVGALTWLA